MMPAGAEEPDLLTLEPLVEAIQDGIAQTGWILSGLQKTTSTEFEGRWAGQSTRSAYLFFHRPDLPEAVSVDVFLDETPQGLKGNLALVVEGPELAEVGDVPALLARIASASEETLPEGYRTPIALRLGLDDAAQPPKQAEVQFRFKLRIPRTAFQAGGSAVSALASAAVGAFEHLLERPEIAELLPPVVE
jgi:hypothetical protein